MLRLFQEKQDLHSAFKWKIAERVSQMFRKGFGQVEKFTLSVATAGEWANVQAFVAVSRIDSSCCVRATNLLLAQLWSMECWQKWNERNCDKCLFSSKRCRNKCLVVKRDKTTVVFSCGTIRKEILIEHRCVRIIRSADKVAWIVKLWKIDFCRSRLHCWWMRVELELVWKYEVGSTNLRKVSK